jgi:hypothetical protein
MELNILYNAKLMAGRKGLDKVVTWVYAKHTKEITPWVNGGEFLLVSGYDPSMGEEDLLQLLEEASQNKISGILIEGGINFKEISQKVLEKAELEEIPLFFVRGVVSFLDITRDISALILEKKYITKRNISLLDQLLSSSSLSKHEINQLFYGAGVSPESYFMFSTFGICDSSMEVSEPVTTTIDMIVRFSRNIQKYTGTLFDELGIKELSRVSLNSVDYLLYSDSEEKLLLLADEFKRIHNYLERYEGNNVYLSFSGIINDVMNISNGYYEAYFTASLLNKELFDAKVMSFSHIGSYQMIYYIEDKKKLTFFRDFYLKKLYDIDLEGSYSLLDTLREYLVQNGNMLQAAKKLIIHRNTLIYRMERIKQIIGLDVNEYNVRRDLQNAFMILDMIPFS